MDIVNMNDVDYINLSANDTTKNATATQLLSRINLFYNTHNSYFGTYFKHYKDLTLESNEKTLQNLPALHYHSYLDTFFNDHLLYSMDIQSNNYYRSVGKSAIQTDLNIPLTLQTSLFDEHMNIAYKTNIYAQHTNFNGRQEGISNDEYSSGLFARNYHAISASSQLTRAYDEITHVIDFGTQYQVSGTEF
jgi:LPS-assembly protein